MPAPPDRAGGGAGAGADAWDDTPTVIREIRRLRIAQERARQEREDQVAVLSRVAADQKIHGLKIDDLRRDVERLGDTIQALNQILLSRGEWVLRIIERLFSLFGLVAKRAGWRTLLAFAAVLLVLACWTSGELAPLLGALGQAIGAWAAK